MLGHEIAHIKQKENVRDYAYSTVGKSVSTVLTTHSKG